MEALSHFERLGLPRRFSLDPAQVEGNYLARSRELHPDYHHLGSTAQQRLSLEMSAALNEAYATAEHKEAVSAFLEKRTPNFR